MPRPTSVIGVLSPLLRVGDEVADPPCMTVKQVASGLWGKAGRISKTFVKRLAEDVPGDLRGEFVANLLQLIRQMRVRKISRCDIAARVVREVQAAKAPNDNGAGFTLEFDIEPQEAIG
ncbi:MAG: hypothetical protein IH988_09685, partial [Planctomycetes bacterium]|nr:hypothetical protein [Planctomycetota bacterium]